MRKELEMPVVCSGCGYEVELNDAFSCWSCRSKTPMCKQCQDEHQAEEHGANDD